MSDLVSPLALLWQVMVGNSNTRWHWGSPEGAAEPAIPWDGWLFPDGTPVSLTWKQLETLGLQAKKHAEAEPAPNLVNP